GGHSLMAVRVVAATNKSLNVGITIKDLFLNPSIYELLLRIEEKKDTISNTTIALKSLVQIKKGGQRLPLYIVSGGGGTVYKFKEFAEMLHPEQPVYGLQQPTDIKDLEKFPNTVEGIAKDYVNEILTENPDGPYALSGHCVGGVIAFEMAKQIEALGKKVEVLAMFDTIIGERKKREKKSFKNLYYIPHVLKRSVSQIYWKARFETHLFSKYTRYALENKVEKLKLFANKYNRDGVKDVSVDLFKTLEHNFVHATKNYKITPYNRDILVFYAKDHYYFLDIERNVSFRKFALNDSTKNIWKPYVKSVTMYEIEGEHSTIFESTNAKEFAFLLQQELDKHNKTDK
ncbi:thioesterase domain-containing protein, partial [Segetibacter aerophilus]|uniref:thioesterase domain-containing protein n=1 Tax=Segetibacter aerophilus TaxID=670293 RepID=UPI001C3FBD52